LSLLTAIERRTFLDSNAALLEVAGSGQEERARGALFEVVAVNTGRSGDEGRS
jgi:hypothetical protein